MTYNERDLCLTPILGPLQFNLSDLSAPGLQFWITFHSFMTLVEKTDHPLHVPALQGRRPLVSGGQRRTFWTYCLLHLPNRPTGFSVCVSPSPADDSPQPESILTIDFVLKSPRSARHQNRRNDRSNKPWLSGECPRDLHYQCSQPEDNPTAHKLGLAISGVG